MRRFTRACHLKGRTLVLALAICALSLLPAGAAQAPGSLDTNFSKNGKKLIHMTDNRFGWAEARDVLLVPGKKTVIGGHYDDSCDDGSYCSEYWALVQLKANGAFDPDFGKNGRVLTDFPCWSCPTGIKDLEKVDGKIIAAGGADRSFAIARYRSDGKLDPNFSGNGWTKTQLVFNDVIEDVVVLRNGKLLAAGILEHVDVGWVRYKPNGKLDTRFGDEGKVIAEDFNESGDAETVVRSGGKFIAAGVVREGEASALALTRYNGDGTLDKTFGRGGRVALSIDPDRKTSVRDLLVRPSGKILVGGYSQDVDPQVDADRRLLLRIHSDGRIDRQFEMDSWADTFYVQTLALQDDGKILAAGSANSIFRVERYERDGAFDRGFGGGDGMVNTVFSGTNRLGAFHSASAMATGRGRIIVAGLSRQGSMAVARYHR